MDIDDFKTLLAEKKNGIIVVKFTAEWCAPCKKIKSQVKKHVTSLPSNVYYYEIDIDDSLDLYLAFKNKKMLQGVPTLFAFFGDIKHEFWYAPDLSISGANVEGIDNFFKKCLSKANNMQNINYTLE